MNRLELNYTSRQFQQDYVPSLGQRRRREQAESSDGVAVKKVLVTLPASSCGPWHQLFSVWPEQFGIPKPKCYQTIPTLRMSTTLQSMNITQGLLSTKKNEKSSSNVRHTFRLYIAK